MSYRKKINNKKSPKEKFLTDGMPHRSQKRGRYLTIVIISCAALSSILIGMFFFGNKSGIPPAVVAATEVTYPVSVFADGKARHFEYKTNDGLSVRYFILKSTDGVIRAAFDACDVCWPENKGYFQRGDFMVCRNCGRQFASVKVNEVKGGCNPAPLNRKVVGDQLRIKVKDLLEGTQYFNFAKRG
jgi:uncharacterized membrane protein